MFECTQKLECTQDLSSQSVRECPEQIGFLGICGNKYPVKKGPNKIGRDPQTCSIVLNLNSISRQHALINVLNKKDFMLMDLDSANKTKLLGKSLIPYVPQPLKNGDMVQFGEVFGIFRLFEEEDDLPMTQALPMTQLINIPDTPVPTRHVSKLTSSTTIPESPDVSDKDDSFIIASQPNRPQFKSSNTHFIKPGKTISIQPVGGHKIDNVFWNSSKKSTSLNLNDSTSSLNDSIPLVNINEKENEANASNINEMETQEFPLKVKETDLIFEANTQLSESPIPPSIYSANTQLPGSNTASPSIYTANTQLPMSNNASPSIYSANTQLPEAMPSPSIHNLNTQIPLDENLPEVCKINTQQDMHLDLCTETDIYNANTQMYPPLSPKKSRDNKISPPKKSIDKSKLDSSSDIVLFDEIDSQSDNDNLESQAISMKGFLEPITNNSVETEPEPLSQIALPKCAKRNRIKSDSSTDCEDNDNDILLSQKNDNPERVNGEEDVTDCEDEMIELKTNSKANNTAEVIDLEDVPTQVIEVLETPPNEKEDFEDMLTQVIPADPKISVDKVDGENIDFEDLTTQVLVEDNVPTKSYHKAVHISDAVEISPFKIPLKSAFKAKKNVSKTPKIKPIENIERTLPINDENYYQYTQDLYEDLCTQRELSPGAALISHKSSDANSESNEASNKTKTSASRVEEKIDNFVSGLSSQEVRDVIGAVTKVATLKKTSSLGSDSSSSELEITPKKIRTIKFMDIDLPSSQEIKTGVSLGTKSIVTESSSESETEVNSEDQCTPILFRKKRKTKSDAKLDLTRKFDVDALPTRVITRVRKPTIKVQDLEGKQLTDSILKPKFLTEQDDGVDRDIITENITRLKSKNEKLKNAKDTSKGVNEKTDTKKKNSPKTSLNIKDTTTDAQNEISPNIVNESKSLTKCDKGALKADTNKTKNRRHNNKSSVVDKSRKDSPNTPEESCELNKTDSRDITEDNIEIEPKRNLRNFASKVKQDNSRGPIMIEPHTINIPVKEEKKKRAYRRKNKESALSNKEEKQVDDKSSDAKPDNTEPKKPVRSSRSKKKISEDIITEPESKTDEKPKRTRANKESKEPSPEKEIRRSKRQRTVKEKEDAKEPAIKSILKKAIHEQSTVYNLSTGSNSDTPNMKRSAEFEFPQPMPKRTRASSRATPSRNNKPCYVLFTAFPYEEVKKKLEDLGAIVVTDVLQCTVLVTLQIRRTFKLLCAVGLGKPIVGPAWVQACADTNMIVDPWLYTIKDETAEKRFKFSLQRTLSGPRGFLTGYNVSSTPNVLPQASEMKLIVQCSGGRWQEGGERWLCVSGAADRALWGGLRARGARLVASELVLGGVLRQALDIDANTIKGQ